MKGPPKVQKLVSEGVVKQPEVNVVPVRMPAFSPQHGPVTRVGADPGERIVHVETEKIDPSPYQNRPVIDDQHVNEIAESISKDGLHQPIFVRPKGDARFELISGEHRLAATRQLGLETIAAIVRPMDDIKASRTVFFDNFFHKGLLDFELYLGFKKMMEVDPNATLRSLERDTGMSKSQIGRVLSYERLPVECLDVLRAKPQILGCNAAESLVALAASGKKDLVVQAVNMIAAGKLLPTQAPSWIQKQAAGGSGEDGWKLITTKDGALRFKIKTAGGRVLVQPKRITDLAQVEDAVFKAVRELEARLSAIQGEKKE